MTEVRDSSSTPPFMTSTAELLLLSHGCHPILTVRSLRTRCYLVEAVI